MDVTRITLINPTGKLTTEQNASSLVNTANVDGQKGNFKFPSERPFINKEKKSQVPNLIIYFQSILYVWN